MKRIISFITVICMILSLFSGLTITAHAATSGTCGDNLTWTLDDDGTFTISGTGAMTNYNSAYYTEWYNERYKIKTIIIENGVTSIGNNAFNNCYRLTSVSIPNSVKTIGYLAFYACDSKNLSDFIIPYGVEHIGDYAFEGCSLKKISIPSSVNYIGSTVFRFCKNLTNIEVDDNNLNYASVDGNLFNKNKTTLIQYAPGKAGSYTIPGSVTYISDNAFCSCYKLTSVSIPSSVKSIGNFAFYDCDALEHVAISNGVTSLGSYAFGWCGKLTNVIIPNSVKTIGSFSFEGCGLTNITIGNGVINIDGGAFNCCYNLTDVYYIGTANQWNAIKIDYENDCLTNATIHFGGNTETKIQYVDITKNGNTYTVELKIENEPKNAKIFVASYDKNGALLEAKQLSTADLTTTLTSANVKMVKAFVWKDTTSFEPICEAFTKIPFDDNTEPKIQYVDITENGDTYTVELKIENEPKDAKIFVASYDKNGALLETKQLSPINLYTGLESTNVETIRAFVWKNDASLTPLCEAFTKSVIEQ